MSDAIRTEREPSPSAAAARLAVATVFFVNGAVFGNWVARIPAVRERVQASEGQLGLALLAVAAGAILAMPVAGALGHRAGSRRLTTVAALALCAALVPLGLAGSLVALGLALFVFGIAAGSLDVAMNLHGVVVERQLGRRVMSSFHALFSFGGMAGAAAGGVMAAAGVEPGWHFLTTALGLGLVVWLASRHLLGADTGVRGQGPAFARPSRSLVGVAALGFCVLLSEGAVADWSALYLRQVVGTGPGMAAAGFAAFSLAMGLGRLLGDRLATALGPVRVVRAGGLLAASGMAAAVALAHPIGAVAGFAGVGLGLSFIFPVAVSRAAREPSMSPGVAIAAISTVGYTGFLVGPPLIGALAELANLRVALVVVAILAGIAAVLARTLREPEPGRAGALELATEGES